MDLKELASGVDPAIHWYYQTKKLPLLRAFRPLASPPRTWSCLDIGAGSGFFSQALAAAYPQAIREVVQVDTAYTQAEILAPPKGRTVRRRELPDAIEGSFVLLMDVLEHLVDDAEMLRQIGRRCRGQNPFFLTVPAFPSVWSYHDVNLGHHRRYTRASLGLVLAQEGIQVERIYYIYGLIFPLVWLHRRLRAHGSPANPPKSDMGPVHPIINGLLYHGNRVEIPFARGNHLWGLTCVAEGAFVGSR